MTALKWTWKIIWRCIFIPVILTFVVMIAAMFLINDSNQGAEASKSYDQNYGSSYQRNRDQANSNPNFVNKYNAYASSDKRYSPKHVEMQDSDFDLTAVIATITLFGSFIFMVIYTIIDIRDHRKKLKVES